MSSNAEENLDEMVDSVAVDENSDAPEHALSTLLGKTIEDAELRFRAVLNSIAEGIGICDRSGAMVYCNPQFAALTGYEPIEMYGKRIYEIFFPAGSPEQEDYFQKMLDRYRARRQGISETYVCHTYCKNGDRRWLEIRAAPLRSVDGQIIGSIGALTDITERRLIEEQFQWSQRMEAVGRLAGGVAHDFNNLLTVICGYSDLLLKSLEPEDSNHRRVELIKQSAETACGVTGQLLALSRKVLAHKEQVDLNSLVESTCEMVKGLLGEHAKLSVNCRATEPAVLADRAQLQQIVVNLLINARDATDENGSISVSTVEKNVAADVKTLRGILSAGQYVVLAVEDNGRGIEPEIFRHLFEPFFTSGKESGSGLGLSTSYALVKQLGGEILVTSEVGVGSRFEVYFPRTSPELPLKKTWTRPVSILDGDETVLVVEDEGMVRRLMAEVLEQHGYKVIEARNGSEALELLAHSLPKPDLIISDIVMANVDGLTLVGKLAELGINIKVILTSGNVGDVQMIDRIDELGLPLLSKPFSPNALLQMVRGMLDRRGRANKIANSFALGW